MSKQFKCSYRCNEQDMIGRYFEFEDSSFRSFMYYMVFTKECNQVFLNSIIKYLLHKEKVVPRVIEDIARRYVVLFIYSYLIEKDAYSHISSFDEILSSKITVNRLKSKIDIKTDKELVKLYLKTVNTEYYDNVQALIKQLKKDKKIEVTSINIIYSMLLKENYYFITSHKSFLPILKKENVRRHDQLIAENITNTDFLNIDIQIDQVNFENYKQNIIASESPKSIKSRFLLFIAYITLEIVKTGNYKLDNPINLDYLRDAKSKILTKEKECTLFKGKENTKLLFLDSNGNVNKSKIISFEYTLNNIRYELSSEGLKIKS